MKRVTRTMLAAGGFFAALGGIAFWGIKRAEAKSGVNKAVLNNPPPQDAKHIPGLTYNAATIPVVGQEIAVREADGTGQAGVVIWKDVSKNPPVIVVQDEHGTKAYATPV